MKKILYLLLTLTLFISCATKNQIEDDEIIYGDTQVNLMPKVEGDDDYIADLPPQLVQSCFAFVKNLNKMKSRELNETYFNPRNNNLEIYYNSGANKLCAIFSQAEREKIAEAANQFLQEHEAHSFVNHKVDRKTAYYTSTCSFWFGLTSPSMGCETNIYYTNYEIYEKHAYFVIAFVPCESNTNGNYTPKEQIYFTPSQTQAFLEILNQDYLISTIAEKVEEAYSY